jgi:[ribosomal protein S5]-alanine N-acetyltransferase
MHIITPRMHLVPATVELLQAELRGAASLSAFIGAYVPADWPPDLYDEKAIRWTIDQLSRPGADGRWYTHYFVLQSKSSAPDVVIGVGGYTGPPDPAGVVEIGYSVLSAYHRNGLATEAAAGLAQNAFLKGVKVVAAHTLEADPASGGVLTNNGFRMVGAGAEPGTSRFEVTKAEFKKRNERPLTV